MAVKKDTIKVYDMTCTSCEKEIERTLMQLFAIALMIIMGANMSGETNKLL